MIIGSQNRILALKVFETGLQKSARGVLRFLAAEDEKAQGQTMATAWLITDSLAVTPASVLPPLDWNRRCFVGAFDQPDKKVAVDLVDPLPPDTGSHQPVLLRLQQPMTGGALPLGTASAQPGGGMYLLHFPEGRPDTQISLGRFVEATPDSLFYDADTLPGSSGGAIFCELSWAVLGMHISSNESKRLNQGKSLTQILEVLRKSSAWQEIAAHHRLAHVETTAASVVVSVDGAAAQGGAAALAPGLASASSAATLLAVSASAAATAAKTSVADLAAQSAALLAAAVRWNFDPESLGGRERFASRVADPDETSSLWVLEVEERRAILKGHTLAQLRKARGKEKIAHPGQKVVDRILRGKPYPLAKIKEAELPYWLQAVRWFEGVVPKLPSVAMINRELGQRRMRSDMRVLTREKVRGRATELAQMAAWFTDVKRGPLLISGLGGIGKSTLISQFVLDQPEKMLLLWLDFDRSDLAPDDAVSVLRVITEQLKIQISSFTAPEINGGNWQETAKTFNRQLRAATRKDSALLVLDGFEIAQHVRKHDEIWGLLDILLQRAPRVRVIVSGRAPVHGLKKLAGKTTSALPLSGMAEKPAKSWLKQRGVADVKVQDLVWKHSRGGVPLILKLALHLIDTGGGKDLTKSLPQKLIEGYLYQRILNRVVNARLKPLAKDVLVLRTLDEHLVADVLADRLPPGQDAQAAFAELARELALVNRETGSGGEAQATGSLQVRPEVRSASLRLLETDNAERVREIDRRAADWYQRQDLTLAENRAELIYHLLRLGRLAEAELHWRPDCARLLKYAVDDLWENAAAERAWLQAKVSETESSVEAWEEEALERIQGHQRRGITRSLGQILAERKDRGFQSALIFYDAWRLLQNGKLAEARETLEHAPPAIGEVQRNRTLLAALIAAREGRRLEAGSLLVKIHRSHLWSDPIEALALLAARVRLTVDVDKELALAEHLLAHPEDPKVTKYLAPCDVVFPGMARYLGSVSQLDSAGLPIPWNLRELQEFRGLLQKWRVALSGRAVMNVKLFGLGAAETGLPQKPKFGGSMTAAQELFSMAWQRWTLATQTLFLSQACDLGLRANRFFGHLEASITSTLVAFQGVNLSYRKRGNLDQLIFSNVPALLRTDAWPAPEIQQRIQRSAAFLPSHEKQAVADLLHMPDRSPVPSVSLIRQKLPEVLSRPSPYLSWMVFLVAPDPLQALCERVAGLPSSAA